MAEQYWVSAERRAQGSSAPLLDRVIQRTGSPGALLDSVVARTETSFLEAKVRDLWASPETRQAVRAAALLTPRLLGGPYLNLALTLLEVLVRIHPRATPGQLAWLASDGVLQMQRAGRVPYLRRQNAGTVPGGPVAGEGWYDDTANYLDYLMDPGGPVVSWYKGTLPRALFDGEGNPGRHTFPVTFPYRATVAGEDVTSTAGEKEVLIPNELLAENGTSIWTWDGTGDGVLDVVQQQALRRWLVSAYPTVHPRGAAQDGLGRLGVPGIQGGTALQPMWRARAINRWRAQLGLAETVEPAPFRPTPRRGTATTDGLNVWPKLEAGPPHQWRRPPPRSREIKVRMYPLSMAVGAIANAVTETGDFIEVIWKSLPKDARTAGRTKSFNRRIDSMLRDIWFNMDRIDWDAFKAYYEANQLEDLYYGTTGLLATAAGIRTGRGAGGFGMGHALGLHGSFTRGWGAGVREGDPVSYHRVDPVKKGMDAYQEWALSSRRAYRRTATYLE